MNQHLIPAFIDHSHAEKKPHFHYQAVVIGGGPAGLMAAQQLLDAGCQVHLFDSMPSVGRKFLLAGKGGLNITHGEPSESFQTRFGERSPEIATWLDQFGSKEVRLWAESLGVDTFVGTSGRVFPVDMKAAPLLRAWLLRLRAAGLTLHMKHQWLGWGDDKTLLFEGPNDRLQVTAQATVLALGGASWPQLGSDGAWVPVLRRAGVHVVPLGPANCGFDVQESLARGRQIELEQGVTTDVRFETRAGWSEFFSRRFEGSPLKSVAVMCAGNLVDPTPRCGEFIITRTGVEGSLIYAVSAQLRREIERSGAAVLLLDLLPDHSAEKVLMEIQHPRGTRSLSTHLKSRLGLAGVKTALLHELLSKAQIDNPLELARSIKRLPLVLRAPRPVAEAISSCGGVALEALSPHLMAENYPSLFCCGEMLDWEAPTGGYLMTASLASGCVAGRGAVEWLANKGTQAS